MNSINRITIPYDFDGIKLTIIADVTPGESMTLYSPGYGDEIESVKITGERKVMGKVVEYELPAYMVDEMRDQWGIDDLIMDEAKKIKRHRRAV